MSFDIAYPTLWPSIFSWTLFLSKSDCFCTKTVSAAVCSHKCAKNVRQAKWLNNAFIKQWEADTPLSKYSNSWFLVSFGNLPVLREKIIPFLMHTLQWIQTWVYAVAVLSGRFGTVFKRSLQIYPISKGNWAQVSTV